MARARLKLVVSDMTCRSCKIKLEQQLGKLAGVAAVQADFEQRTVQVEYDPSVCSKGDIIKAIGKAGYTAGDEGGNKLLGIALIAAAIILLGNYTGGIDLDGLLQQDVTYVMLFTLGAFTSLHCVGMCGGIMLSQTLGRENSGWAALKPAIKYSAGRLLSYTAIGGIVGAVGSAISVTLSFKAGVTVFAGVFMILMGLNLIGLRLPLPKIPGLGGLISPKVNGPFAVGLLNGLLPCGPLQTMQIYALGTGSAVAGATAMFIFALGTLPLMLPLGLITGLMSRNYAGKVLKYSGVMVVVLGIIMANRGLAIAGINLPLLGSLKQQSVSQGAAVKAEIKDGVQIVRTAANNQGYVPNILFVQKGLPVKWIIDGQQINSCNNEIIMPSLNIQKKLRSGENIIEFTPADTDISFSCWMGMIPGVIKVVDDLNAADLSKVEALPSSGGCCQGGSCGMGKTGPSIYGGDLAKVPTDRLLKKAAGGSAQAVTLKGIGYEFEPLVVITGQGKPTQFTFDLTSFDKPEGKFEIVSATGRSTLLSFPGKKDAVVVQLRAQPPGTYGILKDGSVVAAIEVVEDLAAADLEKVRAQLFN